MNKKTSRDVRTDEDIRQWEARLGREWPERAQMAQYIANYVAQLPVEAPIVVELAVGSGYLSESLLRVLPKVAYIGVDRSPALLNYAQRRLEALRPSGDYKLHLADVNEDAWVSWLQEAGLAGKIDAVVSLQSFHDFGNSPQQARAYRVVRQILSPQGHLINANLLLNPRRPPATPTGFPPPPIAARSRLCTSRMPPPNRRIELLCRPCLIFPRR